MDTSRITIHKTIKHGLEVFQVHVNGVFLSEHLSEKQARTRVQRLVNKWRSI